MSRVRTVSFLLAAAILAACASPVAPAPASSPEIQVPSLDTGTESDTTENRTGYQPATG